MKNLFIFSILCLFIFSCSDDKEDDVYLIYVKNKKTVSCLDEIIALDLQYLPFQTTEAKAKAVVEQANIEAKKNYESGKISCQYKYTYIKLYDGMPEP